MPLWIPGTDQTLCALLPRWLSVCNVLAGLGAAVGFTQSPSDYPRDGAVVRTICCVWTLSHSRFARGSSSCLAPVSLAFSALSKRHSFSLDTSRLLSGKDRSRLSYTR